MRPDRPLPDSDDAVMAPFWSALAERRLLLQRCSHCGYVRMPPSELCPECWMRGGEWTSVPPVGTIWSFATYRRSLHPGFEEEVPYTVALVELDGGVRLVGRLEASSSDKARIGSRVRGVFEDLEGVVTLLSWKLDEGA
jgi:hypothetical protein